MTTHPVIRLMHDLGLATWAGGSLAGAVGLNGAAAALTDPAERSRVATTGWSRWAPVNAAGLGTHLVGAAGLLVTDWDRVRSQEGVLRSSAIKTAVTGAGLGVAAWSAALNRKMAASVPVPVAGATEASAATPPDVAATLRQLRLVQWLNPAVSLGLVALTSWQSEQQRTGQVLKGTLGRLTGSPATVGAAAVAGLGLLALRRRDASRSAGVSGLEATHAATSPGPVSPVSPVGGPTGAPDLEVVAVDVTEVQAVSPTGDVVDLVEVDVLAVDTSDDRPGSTGPGAG